ncbi:MAG: PEGA domain-containing protein [Nannocystis sp.]|nr:PEGA domain-containing protein [Nannocystis sp.]
MQPSGRPPPPSTQLPLILIGIGVLGLLVTIIMLLLPNGETPVVEAKTDTKAVETKADVGLPMNRALLRTNVDGVNAQVDGQMQCTTPCEIAVPVGDNKIHEIRLSKPGYIDVVQPWRPLTVNDLPPPLPDMRPIASTIEVKSGKKPR